MIAGTVRSLGLVALIGAATSAFGQTASVESLLALPPAPGVEALLVAHAADDRVAGRWLALLQDANPDLRLSAARALGVTNARVAGPALLQALSREESPAVVAELVQAVAIAASDDEVLQVYAHLDRLDAGTAAAVVDGIAAARPALLGRHLIDAAPLRSRAEWVAAAYARLARVSPAGADAVDRALAAAAEPAVVEGVIQGATEIRRAASAAVLQAAINASAAGRLATAIHLATLYGSPANVRSDNARRSLTVPATEPDGTPDDGWSRELVRRWLGQPAGVGLAPMIEALPAASLSAPPARVFAVLTEAERAAMAARPMIAAGRAREIIDAMPGGPLPSEPATTLALLNGLPPVMLADLVRQTGCRPQAGDERFLSVRFHPDRRPADIAPDEAASWSPGCSAAAHAAVALAYGPPPRADADRLGLLVRLDEEFSTCLADRPEPPASGPAAGASEPLAAPRKLHDHPPVYPDAAIRSRIQGVVAVEGTIGRSGCVVAARVVQAVHPMLDAAALQAVSRWRYTPTLLNGAPVPVIVTVTANFSLR